MCATCRQEAAFTRIQKRNEPVSLAGLSEAYMPAPLKPFWREQKWRSNGLSMQLTAA